LRVHHFVGRQYGLDDLRRKRLKIATLDDLNDPFELLAVDLSPPGIRHAFRELKAEFSRRYGLLCFSRNWHNPVQWSHYAEKHRGLCLVFDVPDNTICRVSYKRQRLVAQDTQRMLAASPTHESVLRLLSTKFQHWHYEEEMRAFPGLEERDPVSGLYFTEFSEKLKLVQVIVGAESTVTRAELDEALGSVPHPVQRIKARLAFRTFRVVQQSNESLWA
jgi:Protein of unknown function (DUF2971)